MHKLSIIIPTYRRLPLTIRHLEYCMKSNRKADEIIVVNDGGDPVLKTMIQNMERTQPIIYARVKEDLLWNYNGACNLGVWLSTGDVIALEDVDHIPSPTTYEKGLALLDSRPEVERIGFRRQVVRIEDVMDKPMSEWNVISGWGTNQMVTFLRRSVFFKLKGQDERFVGRYGYMAMDWASRYRKAGIITATENFYYAAVGDEGEPGLKRGMHPDNRRIYRHNAISPDLHSKHGILNFQYDYEIL